MAALKDTAVTVCGIGGVGSYAAEALARMPVGHLTLIDCDIIRPSNINRQLHATAETIGRSKVDVMAERLHRINPELVIESRNAKLTLDNIGDFLTHRPTWVIDAIDMVGSKVALLIHCHHNKIPVVSSMGAARRLDPGRITVADIAKTRNCPLARDVRKRLRKAGVHRGIQVVYSDEDPLLPADATPAAVDDPESQAPVNGSISYMPAMFGMHCAAVVLRQVIAHITLPARGRTTKPHV